MAPDIPRELMPGDPLPPTEPPDPGWLDTIDNALAAWQTVAPSLATAAGIALAGLLVLLAVRHVTRKTSTIGASISSGKRNSAMDITRADRIVNRSTAVIATAVVAQGMWVLFRDVIPVHWTLRIALFIFIEAQIVAAFRRLRRYMRRTGRLGRGVWTIVGLEGVSATLAAVHAAKEGSLEETLLRICAAAVAAYMLIEELREERDILRHRNPDRYPPLPDWKEPFRKIGVRLGLVEPTTLTVSQVATLRRIDRLARLLDRYHTALADSTVGKIRQWWCNRLGRRVIRQTQAACKYINLAEDPDVRAMLLRRLSIVRGIVEATAPVAGQGAALWAASATGGTLPQQMPTSRTSATATSKRRVEKTTTQPAPEKAATVTDTPAPAAKKTAAVVKRQPAPRSAHTNNGGGKGSTPTVSEAMVEAIRNAWTPDFRAEVEQWTEEQAKQYAAQQARAVLAETDNKTLGMHRYWLTMHATGHEPKGTPMSEAVEAAGSLGRRLAKEWSAQFLIAEVEEALASGATTTATQKS